MPIALLREMQPYVATKPQLWQPQSIDNFQVIASTLLPVGVFRRP